MESINSFKPSSLPPVQPQGETGGDPATPPARPLKSETRSFAGACRVQMSEQGLCVTFTPPNGESACVRGALVDALAAALNATAQQIHLDTGATGLDLEVPVDEATVWRIIDRLDRLAKLCRALALDDDATAQVLRAERKEPSLRHAAWLKNARLLGAGKGDAGQALDMAAATMARCPALAAGLVRAVMRGVEAAMDTQTADAEQVLLDAGMTPELLQQALALAQALKLPEVGLVKTCRELLHRLSPGAPGQGGTSAVGEVVEWKEAKELALDIARRLVRACDGPVPSPNRALAALDDLIDLLAQYKGDARTLLLMEIRTALVQHLDGQGVKSVVAFEFQFSAQALQQVSPALLAVFATVASLMDGSAPWSKLIRQLVANPASRQQTTEGVETLQVVLQTCLALNPHGPGLMAESSSDHRRFDKLIAGRVRQLLSNEALRQDPQIGIALMLNALVCATELADLDLLCAVMKELPAEWPNFPGAHALIDEAQKAQRALRAQIVAGSANHLAIAAALAFLGLKCALKAPATGQQQSVLEALRALAVLLESANKEAKEEVDGLIDLLLTVGPAFFAATPSEDLPAVFDLTVQAVAFLGPVDPLYPTFVVCDLMMASHPVDALFLALMRLSGKSLATTAEAAASLIDYLGGIASPAVIDRMRALFDVEPSQAGSVVPMFLEQQLLKAIVKHEIPMQQLRRVVATLIESDPQEQGARLARLLAVVTAWATAEEEERQADLRIIRASGALSSDVWAAFGVVGLMSVMRVLIDSLASHELEAMREATRHWRAPPLFLASLDAWLADGVGQPQILGQALLRLIYMLQREAVGWEPDDFRALLEDMGKALSGSLAKALLVWGKDPAAVALLLPESLFLQGALTSALFASISPATLSAALASLLRDAAKKSIDLASCWMNHAHLMGVVPLHIDIVLDALAAVDGPKDLPRGHRRQTFIALWNIAQRMHSRWKMGASAEDHRLATRFVAAIMRLGLHDVDPLATHDLNRELRKSSQPEG